MREFGRASTAGPAVLVFLAAVFPYARTLGNGFVYDDRFVVERSPMVQNLDYRGLLSTSYWGEIVDAGLYRPLTLLSFGLNRALGASASGFHLVNVLLHGLAAVAALRFARAVDLSSGGALAAALLFALHPAESESVIAIVGRAEVLSLLFTVASLLLYLRKASIYLVGATFLCALLSKESALFALLLFIFHRRDVARLLALAGAVVIGLALRIVVLGRLGISGREIGFLDNPLAHAGFFTRLLSAPVLLLHYLKLVLWPRTLSADYSFDQIPIPSTAGDPRVLFGLLSLALLLFCPALGKRLAFAAAAFLVPLSGSLHLLFPLGTIFAERLLYFPMLGAALAFGLAIEAISKRRGRLAAGLAIPILGVCALRVWTRVPDWRDNETLFRRTLETSPASARSHFLLGAELLEQKRFPEAAERFSQGLAIYPAHFGGRMSVGEALLAEGDAEAALEAFSKALELSPASDDARRAAVEAALALGRERAGAQDFAAARKAFERAVDLDEHQPSAWNFLGMVAEREGRLEEARSDYSTALREDPDHLGALLNFASLRLNARELAAAEALYRRALELDPRSYEAYNGLGIALARQGRRAEAKEAFEEAIAIDPGLEAARENLRALNPR